MVDVHGLTVEFDCGYFVTVVRYFDAAAVSSIGPFRVPAPLQALSADAGDALPSIVAWRSPTESYCLTLQSDVLDLLEAQWSCSDLGCSVASSDGVCIMRLQGSRTAELLRHLGAATCVPAIGEALTSRIADLPVTAICVREAEVLLAVERVYAGHLQSWIEAVVADF